MDTPRICHCTETNEPHLHVTGAGGSHWLITAPHKPTQG